jgi:hypothetical protein
MLHAGGGWRACVAASAATPTKVPNPSFTARSGVTVPVVSTSTPLASRGDGGCGS